MSQQKNANVKRNKMTTTGSPVQHLEFPRAHSNRSHGCAHVKPQYPSTTHNPCGIHRPAQYHSNPQHSQSHTASERCNFEKPCGSQSCFGTRNRIINHPIHTKRPHMFPTSLAQIQYYSDVRLPRFPISLLHAGMHACIVKQCEPLYTSTRNLQEPSGMFMPQQSLSQQLRQQAACTTDLPHILEGPGSM